MSFPKNVKSVTVSGYNSIQIQINDKFQALTYVCPDTGNNNQTYIMITVENFDTYTDLELYTKTKQKTFTVLELYTITKHMLCLQ